MTSRGKQPLCLSLSEEILKEALRLALCLDITDSSLRGVSSAVSMPFPHGEIWARLQTGGIEPDESESEQLLLRF